MNDFIFDFDDSIPEFDIVVQHVTTEGGGGGQTIEVDSELSTTSNNPVKNKVITVELNKKINASSLAAVATSGSYNDLTNKPTIPSSFPVDVELSEISTNPVQNAVITNALGEKMTYPTGGVSGDVLQKTAEGAQWASIGTPSAEQIQTAVNAYIAQHPDALRPLSPAVKAALLQIAEMVAYIDENGQDYYDALDAALSAKVLLQITAVYTQSGTVYDTDTLDSLKSDLVVTAYYDDGTSAVVSSGYTLSGELTVGTSTVTVTYSGKTATFNVTVTADPYLYKLSAPFASTGTTTADTGVKFEEGQTITILVDFTITTVKTNVRYVYSNQITTETTYLGLQTQNAYMWGVGRGYDAGKNIAYVNHRYRCAVIAVTTASSCTCTQYLKDVTSETTKAVSSVEYTAMAGVLNDNTIKLGDATAGFVGTITDFKIYDGAMTTADIESYLANG